MGHRRMTLLVAAVVCFGAVAWASEPPVGPWQSLNPSLEEEVNPYVPAENTYPEEYNVEQTYYEDEAVEEDIPPLPFKLPFKVDKKQVVVAMKLLKEAVKPILKSKTLRDSLAYFDDAISGFNDDIETQLYVRLILDSLQDIYEGKEAGQIDMILKEFFTEFTGVSDEATARTIEDVWGEYVSPAMKNFVYTPVRKVFGSMMDRVYYPLYAVFNTIAERIDNYFDTDSNSSYLKVDYPDSDRWYETVNYISNRLGYISKSVRNSVEDARMLLEGKACNGCNPAEASQLSVEVLDLGWIGWLVGALVLAAVIAAAVLPPSIAIPVALGVGLGAPTGATGPTGPTAFVVPTGFAAPTAFAAGPTGGFPPPVDLPPGLLQVLANLPLTNRRFSSISRTADEVEESESELEFGDEDAYNQYSKIEYS